MPDASTSSSPQSGGKRCHRDDAVEIVRRLRNGGHIAYFAGGCVRDILLGHEPKDYDVATDAPPVRVRELFRNTQAVGAAFGVILVRLHGSQIEVATFRRDGAYLDGRRPSEVLFTTAQEDAQRRDFTMNGLFLDPLRTGSMDEQIIDYVGGRADIQSRLIRAIGLPEARFEEDHLRLLRAIRFAARFGFEIESRTSLAIQHHARQLARISPERVGEELRVMLTAVTRVLAWELLERHSLTDVIYRFMEVSPGSGGGSAEMHPVFSNLAPGRPVSFGLALAASAIERAARTLAGATDIRSLLQRTSVQRMAKALRQSLKISNDESELMQGALEGLAPLLADELPTVALLKRFLARPSAAESRLLLTALQSWLDPARFAWLHGRLSELERTEYAPPPLITGDDLTAAGLSPGPSFKRILDQIYDEQLEGRLTTNEAALEEALRMSRA